MIETSSLPSAILDWLFGPVPPWSPMAMIASSIRLVQLSAMATSSPWVPQPRAAQ
ncbi:hypothetical protein [Alloactinosynnema sp. L-07]|uniref:hypothetical protein n=1 Tax=Alloactinosynnema sp. L-07 TaxID=1653480 RepID=UPI0012F8FEE5|nr:hypothetical protein [Alloactinosynnema sp. L-07]